MTRAVRNLRSRQEACQIRTYSPGPKGPGLRKRYGGSFWTRRNPPRRLRRREQIAHTDAGGLPGKTASSRETGLFFRGFRDTTGRHRRCHGVRREVTDAVLRTVPRIHGRRRPRDGHLAVHDESGSGQGVTLPFSLLRSRFSVLASRFVFTFGVRFQVSWFRVRCSIWAAGNSRASRPRT